MRVIRPIRLILLYCFLFVCGAYLAIYVYGEVQVIRAQKLVKMVERVQIGQPLRPDELAYFSEQHCDGNGECDHEKLVGNFPFVEAWAAPKSLPLRFLPAKLWAVGAHIEVSTNGAVRDKFLIVDDGKYRQYPTLEIRVNYDPRAFDVCNSPSQFRHPGYHPRREQRSGALYIDVAKDASAALVSRAFHLHLRCLNTLSGCFNPGSIAPEAWEDQRDDISLYEHDQSVHAAELESCRFKTAPEAR